MNCAEKAGSAGKRVPAALQTRAGCTEDGWRGRRKHPQNRKKAGVPKSFTLSVETWEQMEEALRRPEVDGIYCSISMFWGDSFEEKTRYAVEYIKEFGKECYLAFPYIQREKNLESKEAELMNLAGCLDGSWCGIWKSWGM